MRLVQQILVQIYLFILATLPTSQYIEGVVGQPRSFFPNELTTQYDKTISHLIYRGLFKYDIYGALVPDLAESWTVSNGGLVYTIKLKANQKWLDGSKVTSDDLIYTAFKTQNLSDVATDKVDDRTVRFTLPNKFSPFLSLLTDGVMRANSLEDLNKLRPVGNSNWHVARVKRSGALIKEVVLVNFADENKIPKIVFRYYSNTDELITAGKLGEIDGFVVDEKIDPERFNYFKEFKFPSQGVYYALFFNTRNEKFKDEAFRKKLDEVLPIEKLVKDRGIPVQGAISRNQFTDPEIEYNHFIETFLPETLNESIAITVPDIAGHEEITALIKSIWEDMLGLSVTINKVPLDKIGETVKKRDFEILLYGQEIGRDPDRYVNWHSTQIDAPGLNLTGFSHVRADRALEEGRNEVDPRKRKIHYNEFQKVINEQVPAIFLYHPYFYHYITKDIYGVGEKYTFNISDRFLDFANWKRIEKN